MNSKRANVLISIAAVLIIGGSITGAAVLASADTTSSAETTTVTSAAETTTSNSENSDSSSSKEEAKSSRRGEKRGKGTRVSVISVAASVLDKTEDEVKEYVKTGKVGDLLTQAGKVEEFKTAYLEATKEKLDSAVEAGTITQAEADEKYKSAQEKMADYDGTTHLCGGTDHSKMFSKDKKSSSEETTSAVEGTASQA